MKFHWVLAIAVLFLAAQEKCASGDIIVQSDFQGGTVDGWNQVWGASAVTVVADSGPLGSGDFAIRSIPRPSNQLMFPQQNTKAGFVGDYVANGAIAVKFDYRAVGVLAPGVELYAVFLNDAGNRWVSLANVVPTAVWQTTTISLLEPDLILAFGSGTWNTDFTNITTIGFRFQDVANQSGGSPVGSITYELFLDNIQLLSVPEPSSFLFLLPCALVSVARRRTLRV